MYLFNESFTEPSENLAFDEALVEVADRGSRDECEEPRDAGNPRMSPEVLRLWEMPKTCVVLGRASKVSEEVNEVACQRDGVPVLRRVSGGAAIVAGPGCLMYSVLLSYAQRPALRLLDVAHLEVMSLIGLGVQQALDAFGLPGRIQLRGTCDLTLSDRKFSGNALRCKREWMLYHGTILLDMPLHWLSEYLREPPRQPEYRQKREHSVFVSNLLHGVAGVDPHEFRNLLEQTLAQVWNAKEEVGASLWLEELKSETERLLHARYSDEQWHRSR